MTLRLWLPALQAATGSFLEAYRTVAWLCWVPNALAAEFILHLGASHPGHARRAVHATTDGLPSLRERGK